MKHIFVILFLITSTTAFAGGFTCSTKIGDYETRTLTLTPSPEAGKYDFTYSVSHFDDAEETVLGKNLQCVFAKADGAVAWCVGASDPVTHENVFFKSTRVNKLSVEPGRGSPTPDESTQNYYEFRMAIPEFTDEQVRMLTPSDRAPNGTFRVLSESCVATPVVLTPEVL